MLVRSASTPVLGALHACRAAGGHSSPAVHLADSSPTVAYHPPAISCSLSSGGGGGSDHERFRGDGVIGGMRRTCSDGNLSALGGDDHHHHLPRPRPPAPALETIQSFAARDGSMDEEEDDDDVEDDATQEMVSFGGGGSLSQEHPLFLARGLGIDRLGSGLLGTDGFGGGGGMDGGGGGYAVASGDRGDRSGIEIHYKKLIEEDPCNGLFLRNYAQFLYQVKGDRRRAEEYYSRAILADPNDGELLSEYAKLVWDVHGDEERASSYFDRAAMASPHNSHVLAAQAAFLWDTEEGEESGGAMSYTGIAAAHSSMASATT
ncbi:uncharacterized protein LOC100836692 [Brachypodium distachyon]|uniref:Uncharacterized protein n=1 Tax=Brachypodium distachyon TaxID=15368 RepID=I1H9W9_BRADI|nr:uncharacterized protein LOC100836692 [Brachypodium distachyon]KQK23726.1 hypothetical protein BRADI_1g75670v3 [Brachypodium distachyon]|eukprot:XP_003558842.1 uncharacterized protein LOC100836692 [Brachypodium distachyon]